MRTINTADDFADQRSDWKSGQARAVITSREEAERIALPGQDIAVLLSGDHTAGQMAVFEIVGDPGAGAPPHHQTRENEYWYIVDGEWEVQINEDKRVVGPGTMVLVPAMATHTFRLLSEKPGKMLSINAPAGHELFFGALAKEFAEPAPGAQPDEVLKKMERFDTVFEPLE